MLSLLLSTVAFFVASFFVRRYLEDMGIPKGMTRGMVIFVIAIAVAYGVAFLVDQLSNFHSIGRKAGWYIPNDRA